MSIFIVEFIKWFTTISVTLVVCSTGKNYKTVRECYWLSSVKTGLTVSMALFTQRLHSTTATNTLLCDFRQHAYSGGKRGVMCNKTTTAFKCDILYTCRTALYYKISIHPLQSVAFINGIMFKVMPINSKYGMLIQQRSGQLVLIVSQLLKWRSPECSECVSSDCSKKTPVSEGPVTG